jgi:hypothetical protein
MTKFARLDGANTVIELFEHDTLVPGDTHIPAIAALFIECPDTVVIGSVKSGDAWVAPTPVEPKPALLPLLTPMTFYLAFTPAERIAIKKSTDEQVVEFWATYQLAVQLDKPIDPNLVSVREAIEYLATPGAAILASSDRIAQILNGVPQ